MTAISCAKRGRLRRAGRTLGCMANKAPPSGHAKKAGKTLKEKRAIKDAKKADRPKRLT
jgi:hypothetical protein